MWNQNITANIEKNTLKLLCVIINHEVFGDDDGTLFFGHAVIQFDLML